MKGLARRSPTEGHTAMGDRSGIAALEFAVVAGLIVVLMLAVFNFGVWVWTQATFQTAVMAGTVYTQVFPTQGDIANKIEAGMPPGLAADPSLTIQAPLLTCYCGTANAESPCAATCPDPASKRVYVTLMVTRPFTTLYQTYFSAFPDNTARYVVRVQ
jgi:Flp pilus assembly protein TadG